MTIPRPSAGKILDTLIDVAFYATTFNIGRKVGGGGELPWGWVFAPLALVAAIMVVLLLAVVVVTIWEIVAG